MDGPEGPHTPQRRSRSRHCIATGAAATNTHTLSYPSLAQDYLRFHKSSRQAPCRSSLSTNRTTTKTWKILHNHIRYYYYSVLPGVIMAYQYFHTFIIILHQVCFQPLECRLPASQSQFSSQKIYNFLLQSDTVNEGKARGGNFPLITQERI